MDSVVTLRSLLQLNFRENVRDWYGSLESHNFLYPSLLLHIKHKSQQDHMRS